MQHPSDRESNDKMRSGGKTAHPLDGPFPAPQKNTGLSYTPHTRHEGDYMSSCLRARVSDAHHTRVTRRQRQPIASNTHTPTKRKKRRKQKSMPATLGRPSWRQRTLEAPQGAESTNTKRKFWEKSSTRRGTNRRECAPPLLPRPLFPPYTSNPTSSSSSAPPLPDKNIRGDPEQPNTIAHSLTHSPTQSVTHSLTTRG